MTTIGKILVFLVFVAAIAMGGLMVFVAKTTPNWKAAVDVRDKDVIPAYKAMLDQETQTRLSLVREKENLNKLLADKVVEANAAKGQMVLHEKMLEQQVETASKQRDIMQTNADRAAAEAKRLQQELEYVQNTVKDRENTIAKLTEDVAQARNGEQAAKNDAVTAAARNQALNDQLKEKDRLFAELSRKKNQGVGVDSRGVKDATFSNPPPVYVKGQVQKVDDSDKTLVQITIGSDSGIRKGQTLEVYRISPKAEYLGRLEIVDADLHHAVGRLLRQPGMPVAALRPGDEVASNLRPGG